MVFFIIITYFIQMSVQTIKFEQFSSKQLQNLMAIAYKSQIIETQPYQLFLRLLSQKLCQISSKQKRKLLHLMNFHEILLKEKNQRELYIRIKQYILNIDQTQYQQKQCKECLIQQNDIFWKHIEIVYNSDAVDILKKTNKKVQQIVSKFRLKATTFKETELLNMSMIKLFYGSYKEAAKDINAMNPNNLKSDVDWMIAAFIGKIIKKTKIQKIAQQYMINNHPKQILFYIFLGDLSYYQKNMETAITYYKKALNQCHQNKQIAYYKLGIIKKKTFMYSQAIINLKEAIKINDKVLMFHITMAQTYQQDYLTKQAAQMTSKILQQVSKKIQIQKANNYSIAIPRIIYEHYGNLWFQMNSYKNSIHNHKQYKRSNTWKGMRKKPYIMSQQDIQQSKQYLKLAQFYLQGNLIQKAKYIYNNLINNYIYNKLIMSQTDQRNIQKLISPKKLNDYYRSKNKIEKPSKNFSQKIKSEIDENFQNIKQLLQKDQFDNLTNLLNFLLVYYQQNNKISSKLYYFYGQLFQKESNTIYLYSIIINPYIIMIQIKDLTRKSSKYRKIQNNHKEIHKLNYNWLKYNKNKEDMTRLREFIKVQFNVRFAEPYARIGIINYEWKLYSDAKNILQKGLAILIKPENDSGKQKNNVFQSIKDQNNKIIYLIMIEYLSKSYYELNNYNKAKEYGLIYVQTAQTKNAKIYKILGKIYYHEQDYENSLEYFKISLQLQKNEEVIIYIVKIQQQLGQSLTKSSQLIQENLDKHDFQNDDLYKYLQVNIKIIKPQQTINANNIFNFMSQMFYNLKRKLNLDDLSQIQYGQSNSYVSQSKNQLSILSSNSLLDYKIFSSLSELKQQNKEEQSQKQNKQINQQLSFKNNNASGQHPYCYLQSMDQSFNHNINEQQPALDIIVITSNELQIQQIKEMQFQ